MAIISRHRSPRDFELGLSKASCPGDSREGRQGTLAIEVMNDGGYSGAPSSLDALFKGKAKKKVKPVNFNAPPFKAASMAKGPAMTLRPPGGSAFTASTSSTEGWARELKKDQDLLKSCGLRVKEVEGDGACLFRAFADQLAADEPEAHARFREECVDFMEQNRADFEPFIDEEKPDVVHSNVWSPRVRFVSDFGGKLLPFGSRACKKRDIASHLIMGQVQCCCCRERESEALCPALEELWGEGGQGPESPEMQMSPAEAWQRTPRGREGLPTMVIGPRARSLGTLAEPQKESLGSCDKAESESPARKQWRRVRRLYDGGYVMQGLLNDVRSKQTEGIYNLDWANLPGVQRAQSSQPTSPTSSAMNGQLRASSPRRSDETEAMYAKDWTRSVSGHPSPAAIENWKKVRRVSDANKVFNGVLDGVRCRQTEEMYAKDWTQASPSAASDQNPLPTAASAECSASASG
eukprot:s510_g31.t1